MPLKLDRNLIYINKANGLTYRIREIHTAGIVWMQRDVLFEGQSHIVPTPYHADTLGRHFSISIKDTLKKL